MLRFKRNVVLLMGLAVFPFAVAQGANETSRSGALPALSGEVVAVDSPAAAPRGLPSLPGLFQQALEHDARLASQRYQAEATGQNVPMARAGLKPQVTASAGYLYQQSDNYYTDNPDYDPDNELSRVGDDYEARYKGVSRDRTWQVQLSQPLFSLERWRRVGKARAQASAAELQVAVAERDLALAVAESYLDAFLAARKRELLDAKRDALELQARQAQRAYDLGVGDRINLLESRSRLDQAVAEGLRADNELDNAIGELERLTGQSPAFSTGTLAGLSDLRLPGDVVDADAWLAKAGDNLDVELGDQRQRIARADTAVRRAGRYPELGLNVGYSDRDSNDPYRDSRDASASLRLSVPLYQGGYTTASVRQGELTERASQAAATDALNLARQEIRTRLRGLDGDTRQAQALEHAIESSQLFLDAAEKGEQLGLRDLVDVLDARADLIDQRIQLVGVVRQYLLDRLHLQAAVGDLDTQDLVEAMDLLGGLVAPAA